MTPAALAATHRAAFLQERPWQEAEFAALLNGRGIILSGDANSFVLGRVIMDEAEILTVATHPTVQGRGLAGKALSAFETAAVAMGATAAFLEVAADNVAARALYARAGYGQVGQRAAYYQRPDASAADGLILRKDLPWRQPTELHPQTQKI